MPVSYTHLDVYKRQISHMALALLVSRNDDDTVDRTELAKELSHKYTAVSYTHLDVYKRKDSSRV